MKKLLIVAVLSGFCFFNNLLSMQRDSEFEKVLAAVKDDFFNAVKIGDAQRVCAILATGDEGKNLAVVVNATDKEGNTGLILAAKTSHVDCVQLLLNHRSSVSGFYDVHVNHVNNKGESALLWAVANHNQEISKLLLDAREEFMFLRLNLKSLRTAEALAIERGFFDMSVQLTPAIKEVLQDAERAKRC